MLLERVRRDATTVRDVARDQLESAWAKEAAADDRSADPRTPLRIGGIVDPALRLTRTEPLPGTCSQPRTILTRRRLRRRSDCALGPRISLTSALARRPSSSAVPRQSLGTALSWPKGELARLAVTNGGPVSIVSPEEPPFIAIEEVPSGVSLTGASTTFQTALARPWSAEQPDPPRAGRYRAALREHGKPMAEQRFRSHIAASPGARRLTVRVLPAPW